jgi:hypothetical protein
LLTFRRSKDGRKTCIRCSKLLGGYSRSWIRHQNKGIFYNHFIHLFQCKLVGPSPNPSKLFINVGHCSQLPPPIEDLDEEVLLRKLESDPSQIKVPLSIGNLENTEDKTKAKARKVDVLINSAYYKKRVEKSEFYRQLMFMIIIPEVELKHGLVIDAKEHTILRKNVVWDQMNTQYIRKTPAECLIQEEKPAKPINFVSSLTIVTTMF